jgi:hypothetical protein
MPTVLHVGPYRFFFYSSDGDEPIHVHVDRDSAVAKYWVRPPQLDHGRGFRPSELRKIRRIIEAHQPMIIEAWDEFFGG